MFTSVAQPGSTRWWSSPWLYPLNDRNAINALLANVDPLWTLGEIRARVVARRPEAADCCTLVLAPNRWWTGFRAGQHVVLTVEIDGVRHQRCYSLSSSPRQRDTIEITVRRQGLVSNYLHHLQVGAIVELSSAQGDFTVDAGQPQPLLLIGAGSGMTPLLSILRELAADPRSRVREIALIQITRHAHDRLFAAELDALCDRLPRLRHIVIATADSGRPSVDSLLARVSDALQRDSYVCGPAALMDAIASHWQSAGAGARLHLERFAPAAVSDDACEPGHPQEVRCHRSERTFTASASDSLLNQAERAGLHPAYGCRMGICRSCLCHKRSGVVQDLTTGALDHEPNQWIRLCVSRARSTLELDL